jgi:hypothetical protein
MQANAVFQAAKETGAMLYYDSTVEIKRFIKPKRIVDKVAKN